ncbi:MAG: DUF6789 family protein, partial [Actinomycetota bacterium]
MAATSEDALGTSQPRQRLSRALVSGFVATGAMTVVLVFAYGAASLVGSPGADTPVLLRWMWGLANNAVTEETQTGFPIAVALHFGAGVVFALVYALLAEPRLSGPGWRRGMVFSLALWVLSLLAFLPAVGGGFLGLRLGAGPLPILGNLVLHLTYGAVLGLAYASERLQTESGQTVNRQELAILAHNERAMAVGIVAGTVVGGVVGWLGGGILLPASQPLVATVIGAIFGSVAGAFIGSFAGLS